ncbi:hypothetical protein SAMN04487830_107101 [Pseudobutyrivibrio sp. OR37]|uniref:hypothetical protein n=1 Tax=Pseudobutyrivibrio sp. OR37 TaxID=1798186 RepID=UPI0008E93335|nr:hypothetical protein [Pseudobutyrivibrio sp. OR37]SFH76095.1 hypothetical protein SAMN04487830_107101 [Pseudobutyrivibrio sp. OR37]
MIKVCEAEKKWAEKSKIVTRTTLNKFIIDGLIPGKKIDGENYIDSRYVDKALKEIDKYINIQVYIDKSFMEATMQGEHKSSFTRNIKNQIKGKFTQENNKYILPFAKPLILKSEISVLDDAINRELEKYEIADYISVIELSRQEKISKYKLLRMAKEGCFKISIINNQNYVERESYKNYLERKNTYIGIYDLLCSEINLNNTVFNIENRVDRACLNNFLRSSSISKYLISWEASCLHEDRRNSYYISKNMLDECKNVIQRYIDNYGLVDEKWELLMKSEYYEANPKTKEIIEQYLSLRPRSRVLRIADTISKTINCEIIDANNKDIDILLDYLKDKSGDWGRSVAEFLSYIKRRYECNFTIDLKQNRAVTQKNIETSPYTREQYFAGGYMLFSDTYISENKMIEKAIESEKFAILWLHCIWLYIAAWREADLEQIPTNMLRGNINAIRQRILAGKFGDEAEILALQLEEKINGDCLLPLKTHTRQKDKYLVVMIPWTLQRVVGTSFAIVCSHLQGRKIHKPTKVIDDYIAFFGPDYTKIFGTKPIMNRRANKSYEDVIVENTELASDSANKVMGYQVGSYMRAHASSYYDLPPMTSRYLSHKLDGLSSDEVMRMLMEAGVCSFIPYMLLGTLYGKDYIRLPVKYQNELIVELNKSPLVINNMMSMVGQKYSEAQIIVDEILQNVSNGNIQRNINSILERFINHTAIGHDLNCPCINMAQRKSCEYKNRSNCIGCPKSIMEKGILFVLISKIKKANKAYLQANTEGEKRKAQIMLESNLLPAASELLYVLENIYKVNVKKYSNEIARILGED